MDIKTKVSIISAIAWFIISIICLLFAKTAEGIITFGAAMIFVFIGLIFGVMIWTFPDVNKS